VDAMFFEFSLVLIERFWHSQLPTANVCQPAKGVNAFL